MTTTYFHVSYEALLPGQTRGRGAYGRTLIREGITAENDPQGEFFREKVRMEHFPSKPSRFRSSFVFEDVLDARNFRERFRKNAYLYGVRFSEAPVEAHRVCYTAWDPAFPNLPLQAHCYWANPPAYPVDTEIFAEVDLIVIERL